MCAERKSGGAGIATYSLGRHISLLINAYLKEKKERKIGREEGREWKEKEAERDRRRPQNG